MNDFCTSCGKPLKPEAVFCVYCGAKQGGVSVAKSEAPDHTASSDKEAVSLVKQKIVWNIQPGEVARSIKEEEFLRYDSALGIIVNDGTTAYIRTNGETIAKVSGGNYNFLSQREIDRILETRVGENIFTRASRGVREIGRTIASFILGEKVKDHIKPEDKEGDKLRLIDQMVENLKRGNAFAVVLKLNKEFELIFGDLHENIDDYAHFAPMKIQTKYLDIAVGVRALFQISDFELFASHYLADNDSMRTNTLANLITPVVKSILQRLLFDLEIKENRIQEDVRLKVEQELKLYDFHGLALRSLVEISTANEDLQRFRTLSQELYLSEQELDYLHRTNDFKNRLNTTIDAQNIHEAERDLDVFRRLEEINKDKKLSEAELDKFYTLLAREKDIFMAENEDAKLAALAKIEGTGLLREEELEVLRHQIKERDYQRGFALRLTQVKDAAVYEQARLEGKHQVEKQELAHDLDKNRMVDAYNDETFNRQRNQNRMTREDQREDIEFLRRMEEQDRQKQLDALKEMMRMETEVDDKESDRRIREKQQEIDFMLKQQQEKELTEREIMRMKQNMTAEQLVAEQMKELTGDAQTEYARSFSAGKDADKEREMRDEMVNLMREQAAQTRQDHSAGASDMKDMMKEMMRTMAAMSGNMVQNKEEQKEEYREQLHREQNRHDKHQDIALNYTTRPQAQPQQPAAPPQQRVNQPVQDYQTYSQPAETKQPYKHCHKCGTVNEERARFCRNEECGCEL